MFGKLNRRDASLIIVLLLIAAVVGFASWFGTKEFRDQLLEEQAEAEAIRWGELVSERLSDPDATFAYGKMSEEDQLLISTISAAGNVFRYKFYNQDGVVVLGSRIEDLGTRETSAEFTNIVQQGRIYVDIEEGEDFPDLRSSPLEGSARESFQNLRGETKTTVAEAYIPLMDAGRFKGAIEVYVDATEMAAFLDEEQLEIQYLVLGMLALVSIVIGLVLSLNIRDRNRQVATLQKAHSSMSQAEEEVLRLNEELEQRVQTRTAELEKANLLATEAADGMKKLNEELERRVEERTEQMTKANDQLYRLNESMTKLNESLEQRVTERTVELERANQSVQQLNEDLERRVEARTQELQQAQSELVRSERLATLGQLTATVSHELRNPLGAIRTAIYLIRGRTDGHGLGVESALERADRSISRCDNIINELLDFTRSTPLATENTVFDDWLESVLAEQTVSPAITLDKHTDTNRALVPFDHDRLRRVIINVFNNACEAMLEGAESGQVTHDLALSINTRVSGDKLEMLFRDNGPGIPPEVLEKIFEPLYSTKSFGVGLGLPTVRQIMEQHGGGIEIASEVGRGTDVSLWLPLTHIDERAA